MLGKTVRSSSLVLAAALALALGGATAMPSPSVAAPNNGSGATESDVCKSLLDRLKRYHTIATNRHETQAVRDYYAAQARLTLEQGRLKKCQWAARALVVGQGTMGVNAAVAGVATTRVAVSAKRTSKRLSGVQRARRAAMLAGGQTDTRPEAPATIAAIKAQPTGNPQQDEYCSKVADLIEDAYRQGDQAFASGDDEGGQAWYDLAGEFTDRATQNGCRFTFLIRGVVAIDQRLAAGVIAARL
jgi:hypothetical protein